jgi:3-oxoadipate enol-lactonase
MNALGIVNQLFAEQRVAPPAAQQRVVVGDHDTVVAQAGDSGPAVVLVHSAGIDWRMWEPVMTRLASNHRLFAFDVRGHGVSASAAPPISVQQLSDDLITVLNELDLPAAHLVGHAFGGAIALQGALDNPNRCKSLVLLASVDRPAPGSGSQFVDAAVGGIDARIAHTVPRWFTSDDLAHNSWGVRYARERIRRHQQPQWEAAWKLWEHFDVRARLSGLGMPVLLVAGEHDSVVSPRSVAAMAERIPEATYRLLPAATHHQTFSCANAVTSAMDHFYDALCTRA